MIRRAIAMIALGGALLVARGPRVEALAPPRAGATAEVVLLDQAIRHGWHRTDPVVRRRLADDLRFVGRQGAEADLVDEGIALGLHLADPLIRRRLVGRSEQALRVVPPATEADLASWLADHPERFDRPDVLEVTLALSRDGRPASLPVLGARARVAPERLDRLLGAGVGDAVASLSIGEERHLPCAYGELAVTLVARSPGRVPPLAAIRAEVAADWRAAHEDAVAAERLAALLAGAPREGT